MKEKIYLTDDMVILNFDLAYPESRSDLLKSKEFKAFVAHYLEYLRERDRRLYDWAVRDMSEKNAVQALCKFARELIVFDADEVDMPYIEDRETALAFVEGIYDFWKQHARYSITTDRRRDVESTVFVASDSQHNQLLLSTFRRLEQTLMGRANKVYRQQPAGTNASLALYRNDAFMFDSTYDALRKMMFIDSVMLRTPMILYTKSNKREWPYEKLDTNPMENFSGNREEFF